VSFPLNYQLGECKGQAVSVHVMQWRCGSTRC